jgi:hypothetical protein
VARPRWAEREAEDGTEAVEAAEEAEGDEAVEAEGDEAAADTPLVLPQRKKRRTRSAVIEVVDEEGDGEAEA